VKEASTSERECFITTSRSGRSWTLSIQETEENQSLVVHWIKNYEAECGFGTICQRWSKGQFTGPKNKSRTLKIIITLLSLPRQIEISNDLSTINSRLPSSNGWFLVWKYTWDLLFVTSRTVEYKNTWKFVTTLSRLVPGLQKNS